MIASVDQASAFAALPPVWPEDVLPAIRQQLAAAPSKLVVLDDDPTGTQTVYDVPVVTQWDELTLVTEFANELPCFYVLTNSRSLPPAAARQLNLELATNLRRAAERTGRTFTLVSRSDSTLRGHYPVETDALAEIAGPYDATLIFPYFEAGGRITVGNVHFVASDGRLTPAASTPFASDAAFGYRHSDLREWVEEKTGGRILAAAVESIPLEAVRREGPYGVARRLLALPRGAVCIVNAVVSRDAEVLALATLLAERAGQRLLYRTAASFVAARLALTSRPLLSTADLVLRGSGGGLIVAGSHVPKTTAQLAVLRTALPVHVVELSVHDLLSEQPRKATFVAASAEVDRMLTTGRDVLLVTSRTLVTGADAAASLAIGRVVSDALGAVVQALATQPRFVIAKGGITSSDVATHGLGVKRAWVRGQILPGVPVWELGAETKFPGIPYVVFPGNVGGDDSLKICVEKLAAGRR